MQVKHPSALIAFDRMMSIAKEKMVVVFLDYDGTLSPIVDDPELAFMSNSVYRNLCFSESISKYNFDTN